MPIIEKLESKVNEILLLKKDYDLVARFNIVVHIHSGLTPGFAIYSRASKLAAAIGADFDIDMYASPFEDLDEE